jgi:iron complex transport system permease protein
MIENEEAIKERALTTLSERYSAYIGRKTTFLLASIILIAAVAMASIKLGYAQITTEEMLNAIFSYDPANTIHSIIVNVRLPRVLMAVAAGAALAAAGAVMQCILRNPLASPYTMGISQAAAFGAAFAIIILNGGLLQGFSNSPVIVNNPYLVTLSAFIWSLVSVGAIILLARMTKITPEAMILAGVAIAAIFAACITLLQYIADNVQLASIVYWTFGDLGRASWPHLMILVAICTPFFLYFIWNRWNYNALDAGEETAKGLGVNVDRQRLVGLVVSSLIAAVVVSFMGIIGFIGLLGPHIVRRLIGADYRYLIPGSLLFGALILLVSDTVSRTLFSPMVLPVGVITAFMGGPLFIYLLVRRYR